MDLADRTDVEPDFNNIPKCLTDTWRIDRKPYANDNDYIEGSEELRSWSISSLIALFLHTSEDQRCTIHPDDFDFLYQSEDLRGHLMHPKLSYHSFRELVVRDERKGKFEPRGPAVKPDIDATILHSEIHIRALAFNAEQHRFYPSLVGLSYLLEILAPANEPRWFPPNPDIIEYRRKPVEAALKVLDDSRPSTLSLHVSDTSFAATFARITNNILKGLSYQNTAVAGGMVLTALLHVDPARDQDKRVQDPDLDLYIYGLSPAETEEKVFEIERVWRRNLPVNSPTLVTRNNRTITFISSYPNRRLQVILKTLPNLTAVLLNFDLDICALAWTGTFVEMLPRCARAIETGYSMFTMDLIWGSHLSDRRSTQEARVWKYADRGFGIRFLPLYGKLLEVSRTLEELPWCEDRASEITSLDQIASAASAFVDDLIAKRQRIANKFQLMGPQMKITADDLGNFATNGRKGMDNLEVFMRHCAAWSRHTRGEIIYLRAGTNGTYDPAFHDDTPAYDWNESFNARAFMDAIDNAATQLGTAVQNVLNNPDVRSAEYLPVLCSGRQVYGSRLRSVLKQPLVIPVLIPRPSLDIGDLQTETGTSATPALPPHLMNMLSRVKSRLIGESRDWELKCWYITGDAKWGSMDRFGDEVTELMWSLHGWFKVVSRKSVDSSESSRSSFMLWAKSCGATEVARRYRRRFILPNVPLHHPTSFARLFNGYPTLRESLLFRAWVRRCPPDSTRY